MNILYYILFQEIFAKSVYSGKLEFYSGLDFLGVGYNAILAFPFGLEDTNLDPGFTCPLVNFTFNDAIQPDELSKTSTKMISLILPDGVWYRKDYACRENKISRIIDSDKVLKKIISEDVTTSLALGPIEFTNNSEFRKLERMIKNENYTTWIYKSQCASSSMGFLLMNKWSLVDSFKNAIKKLPKKFKGFDPDFECKYKSYVETGNEICNKEIKPWLDIFNNFGTHITTRLVLGGKLIHIVNKRVESDLNKAEETYSSIKKIDLSVANAGLSYKNSNKNDKQSKSSENKDSYYVTGGNAGIIFEDKDNFKKWSKTVYKNQMPIKIDITPLSELLPNRNLKLDYWKALKYYKLVVTSNM